MREALTAGILLASATRTANTEGDAVALTADGGSPFEGISVCAKIDGATVASGVGSVQFLVEGNFGTTSVPVWQRAGTFPTRALGTIALYVEDTTRAIVPKAVQWRALMNVWGTTPSVPGAVMVVSGDLT